MKKDVLGVKIDDVNLDQALEVVIGWLKKHVSGPQDKHYIVTPNPEIVMMAQKDEELKKIINNADLAIPDGVGLKLLTDIVCLCPGIDLMEKIIGSCVDYGFTIGFLGGGPGVAEQAAKCLRKKYPKIKIVFADSGGEVDNDGNRIGRLPRPALGGTRNDKMVDILFVGFGPPKQEKWIAKNLSSIPVRVAMGVGGSLDYLSGKVPRAPKLIRSFGFEWLFRLILQPWRMKRQMALLKFVYYILRTI